MSGDCLARRSEQARCTPSGRKYARHLLMYGGDSGPGSVASPKERHYVAAAMSLASTLAHAQLRNHFHACAFVASPAEEQAVIDPFFVEGMRRGEKAVYIVDPDRRDEHER